MSDETTLLPCPICGRKATINSWWSSDEECGVAGVGCSRESYTNGYECARIHIIRVDEKTARKDAIRIWNTRAERGTLTAELVERIVDRNCEWYEGGEIDAQAIADELNATLGGGTCEFVIKDNMNESEGMGDVWIECSACHCQFDYYADDWLMKMSYCPNCSARNRKAVER